MPAGWAWGPWLLDIQVCGTTHAEGVAAVGQCSQARQLALILRHGLLPGKWDTLLQPLWQGAVVQRLVGGMAGCPDAAGDVCG